MKIVTMPTANKFAANLARIEKDGVKNMAEITRLIGQAFPLDTINFAGIHTRQTLEAAGITTECSEMVTALYVYFDNDGLPVGAAMSAQCLTWLKKQLKVKNNPHGTAASRETYAIQNFASITWSNVHAVFNRRNGENLYYSPVFTVTDTDGDSFDYVVTGGFMEIIG